MAELKPEWTLPFDTLVRIRDQAEKREGELIGLEEIEAVLLESGWSELYDAAREVRVRLKTPGFDPSELAEAVKRLNAAVAKADGEG